MAERAVLMRQAAVVAQRNGQVCLVQSRSGKRWVIPKGGIESGKSAGEIALQEAWEEAGLVGVLEREPLGSYIYTKDGSICHVIVFAMNVTGVEENYPEAGQRQRLWLPLNQAISRIDDAGLCDILRALLVARAS